MRTFLEALALAAAGTVLAVLIIEGAYRFDGWRQRRKGKKG